MARRTRGFWTGLMLGLVLGVGAVVALALFYPLPTAPPDVDEARLTAPGEPAAPSPRPAPEPPRPQALIPGDRPVPLIAERPGAETPPERPRPAPPARDPFADAETGSPSLFPGSGQP